MQDDRTVSLTISLPKTYRDLVRRKAAEWNMANPDELVTGARIARDIVMEYLDQWKGEQGDSLNKENALQSQTEETLQ
jgi:hypothetical protein